jgi:CheY-like chemotaxis protein
MTVSLVSHNLRGAALPNLGTITRALMSKPVILVADDRRPIRLLVTATLADDDFEVLDTDAGDSAWTLIQERVPALVILDVQMPGRTGIELTLAIPSR